MGALMTLQDLNNKELFDLARLFVATDQPVQPTVLLEVAAEFRRRGFTATEDYLVRLAAEVTQQC